MPMETEIRAAEERLRAAMLANDVEALRDLLHDELRFKAPDGTVVGKNDDLAAHTARRLQLTSLDIEEMTFDGTRVAVRAILRGTFDGAPCDGTYAYERTWTKTAERWQVIAGGVTLMARSP